MSASGNDTARAWARVSALSLLVPLTDDPWKR